MSGKRLSKIVSSNYCLLCTNFILVCHKIFGDFFFIASHFGLKPTWYVSTLLCTLKRRFIGSNVKWDFPHRPSSSNSLTVCNVMMLPKVSDRHDVTKKWAFFTWKYMVKFYYFAGSYWNFISKYIKAIKHM